MDQEKIDQEWQQMELRIHQLVDRLLRDDTTAFEHRTDPSAFLDARRKNKMTEMEDGL